MTIYVNEVINLNKTREGFGGKKPKQEMLYKKMISKIKKNVNEQSLELCFQSIFHFNHNFKKVIVSYMLPYSF